MGGKVRVELAGTDRGEAKAFSPRASPKEDVAEALEEREDGAVESEGRARITIPRGASGRPTCVAGILMTGEDVV